ncbi:MAG: helix-turn-helix transcriptional regulator [Ruminococcus sp.]|nr:helix-turn-helix transcriptional regulator [Ruminococcus sp.]
MNQLAIGKFIALKRKEKNLTQEQLAEQLNISNKTVSKWETGKCMPDYSVIKNLCEVLEITISELMDGEEEKEIIRSYDEEQTLELLRRVQELERQKNTLYGMLLIVMGIAMLAIAQTLGGSAVRDFFAGLFLGMSIAEMLVGVYVVGKGIAK